MRGLWGCSSIPSLSNPPLGLDWPLAEWAWTAWFISLQGPRWNFLFPSLPLDATPVSQEQTPGRSEPSATPFLELSRTPGRTGCSPFQVVITVGRFPPFWSHNACSSSGPHSRSEDRAPQQVWCKSGQCVDALSKSHLECTQVFG